MIVIAKVCKSVNSGKNDNGGGDGDENMYN
jgi:hypothetical protein